MATASQRHPAVDLAERRLKALARQHLPRARIRLFGSRATGEARRRSDFDLAVELGPHGETELWAFEEAIRNDSEIIYPVDVVDLAGATEALREKIENEGVVWTS